MTYAQFVRDLNAGDSEEIKQRLSGNVTLLHGIIGICTEAGEIQDQFKKHVWYGKELDMVNIKEELGDILWYIQLICNEMVVTITDLQITNMRKLEQRYKGKFSTGAALDRDLEAERKELEV